MSDEELFSDRNIEYTPEQFHKLATMIHQQDGEHVDELCSARSYSFTGPNPDFKEIMLPGCGNYSIFEIPYVCEPVEGTNAAVIDKVKVCAVCDALGWTPRFAAAMENNQRGYF